MTKVLIFLVAILQTIMPTAAQSNPDGRVISGDIPLRLRAGPGLHYDVLDLIPDGTLLAITGRSPASNWLEIRTLDQIRLGWVFSQYVAINIEINAVPIVDGDLSFRNLITNFSNNTHTIYVRGQRKGNQPNVFAKVGDSITASYHALHPLGDGSYNLHDYQHLQATIDYFSTGPSNGFKRDSQAAGVGWNAAAVLLSRFADPTQCEAGESPLECEYRLLQPAFALIMLGTNDVGYVPLETYRYNMQRIIDISIERGIIPIISTIPPRRGYEEQVLRFNQIIRELAQRNAIPLWDYGYAMAVNLPSSLTVDGVHPSLPLRGHEDAANFTADNLNYGYVLRNLSALYVLDALRQEFGMVGESGGISQLRDREG